MKTIISRKMAGNEWQPISKELSIIGLEEISDQEAETVRGGSSFTEALQNSVTTVTGPTGGAIATLAIVAIGVGAMLGQVSFRSVIIRL